MMFTKLDGENNKDALVSISYLGGAQKSKAPSLAIINTLSTSPYMSSQAVEKLLRSEKLIITAH